MDQVGLESPVPAEEEEEDEGDSAEAGNPLIWFVFL